jgi:plasmid stability protein
MSVKITVELPEELAQRTRVVAARTGRALEATLIDLIDRASETPVELLSDQDLLNVCDQEMEPAQQEQLSELLDRNREGTLDRSGSDRLDDLMRVYRRGLVRKAQALQVAVARGLKPRER